MQVGKFTAHDGQVFYNTDFTLPTLKQVVQRLNGLRQVDIIEMTDAEYRSIPATSEAAVLFK